MLVWERGNERGRREGGRREGGREESRQAGRPRINVKSENNRCPSPQIWSVRKR